LLELIKESHDILKMKTELGTIGFFNNNLSNNNLKLKDPSMFLKWTKIHFNFNQISESCEIHSMLASQQETLNPTIIYHKDIWQIL